MGCRRDVLRRGGPGRDRARSGQPVGAGRAGTDGADPDADAGPGRRGGERVCGGRRAGTGPLVRPAGGRGGRHVRGVLPAVGGAADRRRDGTAAADRRAGPGAGHDPHRPGGGRGRGAVVGVGRPGRAGRRRAGGGGGARRGAGGAAAGLPAGRPGLRVRHGRPAAGRGDAGRVRARDADAGERGGGGRRGPVHRGRRPARNPDRTRQAVASRPGHRPDRTGGDMGDPAAAGVGGGEVPCRAQPGEGVE